MEQRPRGGAGPGGGSDRPADWLHMNAVDYNPHLDQIVLSVHGFSEFWIIDHSTTTKEATSDAGGQSGQGGDLLYRWGNPQAYRNGSNVDRRLYQQHSVHWIPEGLPGAGNILLFNNGSGRPDGNYSSVDEIDVPITEDGRYERDEYVAFGPTQPTWSYTAKDKEHFFSHFISGACRLPNGNTLICSGAQGIVFEVTSEGKTVWQYKHPGVDQAGGPESRDNREEDAADGGLRIGGPGGLFRVYRYASNYSAFDGKTLTPGEKVADLAEATD